MSSAQRPIGRRQLGAELRRLRIGSGKNQSDLATVIECDTSLISRVEKGERALKVLELNALLDFLGVDPSERAEIISLGQQARAPRPRRVYADALPNAFRRLSDLEDEAREIFYSSGELVPGMLQTAEYMRALMRSAISRKHADLDQEIETRVGFRLERQQILDRADPPRMWFVIGEAALRRPIGRFEVMNQQLKHLIEVIDERPWLTVQAVPLSVADHPLLDGSLNLFRFGGGLADIVHQSTFVGGGVYVQDRDDTEECFRAYDRLRAVALGPAESRDFIEACRKELSP